MKSTPGSRFKVFTSREAAVQYSRGHIDCSTPKASKQVRRVFDFHVAEYRLRICAQ